MVEREIREKKIPPGCRNFETAAVGKFHFWSIQTCCYQSMELTCNSAVSYGSLLSIYRMGRKVKHLVGGSEALHGSRVGFSYKVQCRHNFYNTLNFVHLMESIVLCLIIIHIDGNYSMFM